MGREDQIINERLRKLKELRKQGINPYPNKYESDSKSLDLQKKYHKLKPEGKTKDTVKIAGRLMSVRDLGKIAFGVLNDGYGKIQITLQDKETPKKSVDFFKKFLDAGDFIGVQGTIFRTKRGELSILVKDIEIVSKSILPLPEKWHGLKDDEERLRKRYLDILMNPDVKNLFLKRAKFWHTMRSFLIEKEFLEVDTPVLETSPGGAAATPFTTHHNSLNMDVYLRISMGELWQKKLMIAGFPKTFEIGRQFRNEGMDMEHLQDYTQMEFYWAYANHKDGMALVEEMYKRLAKEVLGTLNFETHGHKVDLSKKWVLYDYESTIKKFTGIDIFKATKKEIEKELDSLNQDYNPEGDKWRQVDSLWKYCRRKLVGPGFLVNQPAEIIPLAKRNFKDPRKVEQFQVILAGTELGNGYSELNDPIDQEERFKEQAKLLEKGDSEAHHHDKDFVEALKYGMPPTCGFGVSIRLFAYLIDKPIRECVLFPLVKPRKGGKNDRHNSKK